MLELALVISIASAIGAAGGWYLFQQHGSAASTATANDSQQERSAERRDAPNDDIAIEHLRQIVLGSLKDPDSAQFSDLRLYKSRMYNFAAVYSLCGRVNAKNSFGGYAGPTDFVVFDSADPKNQQFRLDGRVILRPIDDPSDGVSPYKLAEFASFSALYCRNTDLMELTTDLQRNRLTPADADKWYHDVYRWGPGKQLPHLGWVLK
ncbi:hypothetical protein [Burkholderia multivorans]|uniref:hypothetical protein n=1 Tax=Burkholderia multivorans TaxID=87883 RepID=UPI0011B25486|nr:hypothetical protein [Burkholderia multivorans]